MKASLILCTLALVSTSTFAVETKEKAPVKPSTAVASETAPAAEVKNVTPDEAEKILKSSKDVVVLDVRTPEEFQDGHIKGAKNLDVQDDAFAEKLKQLDKDKTYVLHCAAGGRSSRVLKQMRELNFKSIYHMNDGFSAWKEAGKPLEK
jgi:rhodanese-related sulfurtransferase